MIGKIKYATIAVVLIFCCGLTAYAGNSVSYSHPFPKDLTVYYAKPEIGMKLILNGNSIGKIDAKLDGTEIKAEYDYERQMIVYQPENALSAGVHNVSMDVYFKGWDNHLSCRWRFTVDEKASDNLPDFLQSQADALEFMNDFRNRMGLSELRLNRSLDAAAAAHTNYMLLHRKASHDEYSGEEGYTGATPLLRAYAQGYSGIFVGENLCAGFSDMIKAMQEMIAAPYHRLAWINPFFQEAGYYGKKTYHTVLFGSASYGSDRLIAYPYNGQNDVPFQWVNREEPNPLREKNDDEIGYPITVSYFSRNEVKGLKIKSAVLKDEYGRIIDIYVNTYENDKYLTDSIILIPEDPLDRIERYDVEAKLVVVFKNVEQQNEEISFSFTTAGFNGNYYDDIADTWAKDTINKLAKMHIIDGYTKYSYYPDIFVSRADFCEFVVNMLGAELKPYEGMFADVGPEMPDARKIEAAERTGIIKGYADGSFKPEAGITREEMALIVKRIYEAKTGKTLKAASKIIHYNDSSSISAWAADGVEASNELGILRGSPNGYFYPKQKTTRAEAAEIIKRLCDKLTEEIK